MQLLEMKEVPPPLKLQPCGGIEMNVLLLY